MTPTVSSRTPRPAGEKQVWSWLLATGLLSLLLVLATLQYRWLEEVSRANRDKSRDLLQAGAARFAEDFDRELTRAFLLLQPRTLAPASVRGNGSREVPGFVDGYRRWQSSTPFPDLIRDVYMARRGDDGAFESARFDPATGLYLPAQWPAEMESLGELLVAERWRPRRRGAPSGLRILADEIPALILPFPVGGPPDGPDGARVGGEPGRPPGHRARASRGESSSEEDRPPRRLGEERPGRRGGPPSFFGRGLMVVRLDLDVIREVILPRLSEQHLHVGDADRAPYQASVFALRDQRVIFHRGAAAVDSSVEGDAEIGLFTLLPPEKLGTLELEAGLGRLEAGSDPPGTSGPPAGRFRGRSLREGMLHRGIYRFVSAEEGARWRLVVSHPAGSLDAAVTRAHRRNLGISFGILLLLGASLLLMQFSTRRLQALARQQLEFVAGVTHELLTPLAAMRSAGQNLADGVVAEPSQVRRYGRLVEHEGRRLSTMVEQVLEFAGIQAGGRSYALDRVRPAAVIEDALAEYRPVLDEQDVRVDKDLDDDLPDIMADAGAMRRAVQNLIANAVKYGSRDPAGDAWIGLRAVTVQGSAGRELRLSVEDRGPGIAAEDQPRLFEPFFRGRNGSSDAVSGSGLGLSLVKHIVEGHGGRVTVSSEVGVGSTFTLHLPVIGETSDTGESVSGRTFERDGRSQDEL